METVTMDTAEAAAFLGVSTQFLKFDRSKNGPHRIPYVKLGDGKKSSVKYLKEDLVKYLHDNRVTD